MCILARMLIQAPNSSLWSGAPTCPLQSDTLQESCLTLLGLSQIWPNWPEVGTQGPPCASAKGQA